MKKSHDRFARGSGCYTCLSCGKLTRDTGNDEADLFLCAYCYHESGLENSLADALIAKETFDARLAELKAKYRRT